MNETAKKLLENEFYDIPYKTQKKYMDYSIQELITELDRITHRVADSEGTGLQYAYVETQYDNNKQATTLELLICERLGLFRGYDLLQIIRKVSYDNEQRIKELEKQLKTHRHDTTKSYSEKPAW